MRHAQLGLLAVVDELNTQLLPCGNVGNIWAKLRVVTQAHWLTVEDVLSLGDCEFAAVGRGPYDFDGVLVVERRRPDEGLVFRGHRGFFLPAVEVIGQR